MAGHSKFANIKHRKGAQDAKRAKLFTKLQRELTVATKLGKPDPNFNPRLRSAIIAARSNNMPKDRIESAIKKASTVGEGDNFEEIRYEGYGARGVAFVVEALTDNKNRTAGEVRSIFSKSGGSLAETGSVSFMFDHIGLIEYNATTTSEDEIFEFALEAGATEIISTKEWHSVCCNVEGFTKIRDALIEKYGDPSISRLDWKAKEEIDLDLEAYEKILKLVDALEDNDDVQLVCGNYNISDDLIQKVL